MRTTRLRLSDWLYRLAHRIDPGDDPNAPKCIDCGCPEDAEGCPACDQMAELDRRYQEVYDAGSADAWRDAEREREMYS